MLSHQGDGPGGRVELTHAARDAGGDALLAGVNVGGTTTSVVLGTPGGAILERRAWPTQAHDGEALYAAVVAALHAIAGDAQAVGVAIGGPMDARTGVVISAPHLPGMHGFPLGERLRADFAKPIAVHHDAAACALAEVRWGADRGAGGLAYLTVRHRLRRGHRDRRPRAIWLARALAGARPRALS